jgi:hypothetical protein
MNSKKITVLCMIIVTLFVASFASKASAQTFEVNVVPSKEQIAIDEEVTVNVTVTGVTSPGIYSYELKLYYNTTLLNATGAELPSGHFLTPSLSPDNIYVVERGKIHYDEGYVGFAATLTGDEPGKTGSGTLGTVTFKGLVMGNSSLWIPAADLIFVDPEAAEIDSANYTNTPSAVEIVPEFALIALMVALMGMSAAAVVLKKKFK